MQILAFISTIETNHLNKPNIYPFKNYAGIIHLEDKH